MKKDSEEKVKQLYKKLASTRNNFLKEEAKILQEIHDIKKKDS